MFNLLSYPIHYGIGEASESKKALIESRSSRIEVNLEGLGDGL